MILAKSHATTTHLQAKARARQYPSYISRPRASRPRSRSYAATSGCAPSAPWCNISKILEHKGYIVRRKNAWRNIELRNADGAWGTVSIPVVANVGCDDLSVFAQEQHDEFIEVDKKIVEESGEIVAVRAVGDSMHRRRHQQRRLHLGAVHRQCPKRRPRRGNSGRHGHGQAPRAPRRGHHPLSRKQRPKI